MKRILFVADDPSLISGLSFALKKQGYEIDIARTGMEAGQLWQNGTYALVILDVSLPDSTGYDLCRKIRETSRVPIMFLTAADEETDIIMGLDMGGDDYITKPFSFPVLVAKAQALMRRARGLRLGASELGYANILMDTASGTVTVDGNPVNLRPKEAKILELLLREQGRTVSRDLLIERVWGTDFDGDERMIDRHIASLRKALGTASQHIRAVYGKGYRLGGST